MSVVVNSQDLNDFFDVVIELTDNARVSINNDLPSVWIENNIVIQKGKSGRPGKLRYYNTPHTREIVDHWSQSSPIKEIVIMKSAQSAITESVILSGLVWMMVNDPGNAKLLVGHHELLENATNDLDTFIDSADVGHLLGSQSKRKASRKTGDTDTLKEFPNGFIGIGLTKMDSLRQVSLRYLVLDDFDAMISDTKKDGGLDAVVLQRQNSFAHNRKLWKVSTSTVKGSSNIEKDYLKGDQRKWHILCPCCNTHIVLEWEVPLKSDPEMMAGIVYELDDDNRLIPGSVGYRCQECGDVFDDSDKMSWLNAGKWIPTATSTRPDLVSYHFNALSSPTFMYSWEHYVYQWLNIMAIESQVEREKEKHSFYNLVLGLPYERVTKVISANKLQKNIRNYEIGTIPDNLAVADGNGPIVFISCTLDLGGMMDGVGKGTRDDVRIDWEVRAFSASGQSYSIDHGSIGTFVRRDKKWQQRADAGETMTYAHGVSNSVWPEVKALLDRTFKNDRTGKDMRIFQMAIDAGFFTDYVYKFLDANPQRVIALKGDGKLPAKSTGIFDYQTWQKSKSRSDMYIVRTDFTKDIIANHMELPWKKHEGEVQPFGFMNFPIPSGGKYLKKNFFDHYEAEEKRERDGKYFWDKKPGHDDNHYFDLAVYHEANKDIFVYNILTKMKAPEKKWDNYAKLALENFK